MLTQSRFIIKYWHYTIYKEIPRSFDEYSAKHKKTNDNPISRKYRKKNNSFEKKKYTNLKKIPLNIQNKHKKIKKETSTHYNVVYPSLTVQFIPDLRGRGVLAKIW